MLQALVWSTCDDRGKWALMQLAEHKWELATKLEELISVHLDQAWVGLGTLTRIMNN